MHAAMAHRGALEALRAHQLGREAERAHVGRKVRHPERRLEIAEVFEQTRPVGPGRELGVLLGGEARGDEVLRLARLVDGGDDAVAGAGPARVRAALAAGLLACLGAAGFAASAEADVLVSNTGKGSASTTVGISNNRTHQAQGFHTGPNAAGYRLTSVEAVISRVPTTPAGLVAEPRTATGRTSGRPHQVVRTLTNPGTFSLDASATARNRPAMRPRVPGRRGARGTPSIYRRGPDGRGARVGDADPGRGRP